MSLLRFNFNKSLIRCTRRASTAIADPLNDEYTATPQYPPILDISNEKKLERKKMSIHEEIKAVKTVEEKQIKLNMPRYYGFHSCILNEHKIPYNNLQMLQYITRTHLIETKELPDYYKTIDVDKLANYVKGEIEEALLIENEGYKHKKSELTSVEYENKITKAVVQQLNRTLINNIVQDYNHLLDTQVDYEPRIESSWVAGGMPPPENIKRYREATKWQKDNVDDPIDRTMQYTGQPVLTLRNALPLKPIVSQSSCENLDVPSFDYDPRTVGIVNEHKHCVNTPGFWPGEEQKFGLLAYHTRGHLIDRHTYIHENDTQEALNCQAVMAAFGWLNAQANFLGFTTYNDITYPLVTQGVITNGKIFSFYAYQLNTLLIHSKYAKENPKTNVMWALPEMKLFEEISDGKLIGFNDEVLKLLLKYYVNVPEERLGLNMTPYLGQDEQIIADYQDDDKRSWLEREYKFLVSNRPRFKLDYEIYHWEKIYKIDHKTRNMEPRRRPFELFKKPHTRKLNERQAFYIPRALRPDLPRHKGRYAKEYFP